MEIFLDVKVKWKWEKSENLQNKKPNNWTTAPTSVPTRRTHVSRDETRLRGHARPRADDQIRSRVGILTFFHPRLDADVLASITSSERRHTLELQTRRKWAYNQIVESIYLYTFVIFKMKSIWKWDEDHICGDSAKAKWDKQKKPADEDDET